MNTRLILVVSYLIILAVPHAFGAPLNPPAALFSIYLPVVTGSPQAAASVFQANSAAVSLSGAWVASDDSRAYGGNYILNNTVGDGLQFSFTGSSLALYRRLDVDGGRAEVQIDGHAYGSLEFFFDTQRWQAPALFDNLGDGSHTLVLKNSRTRHGRSTGFKIALDAFVVPSPFAPTAAQQTAITRVNYHRALAGLPPGRGAQAIHQAAQSHAEFIANHQTDPRLDGLGFHSEPADLAGYVGAASSDRVRYFGYTGYAGEDGARIGDAESSVDAWMTSVYHRDVLMGYATTELGYGVVNDARGQVDVLNIGSRMPQAPANRTIYTYPADHQVDVPPIWKGAGEVPDPFPGLSKPSDVGYPISLHIVQSSALATHAVAASRSATWKITSAEVRDAQGQVLPVYSFDQDTDPNGTLDTDRIFLVPQLPMAIGATYTAHVVGLDSQGVAFDHRWSFTTQLTSGASNIHVTLGGACGAQIDWTTTETTTTRLEYGLSAVYDKQAPGHALLSNDHLYRATLQDLAPNLTYHYRVVVQDAQGTRASSDRTFTTRSAHIIQVPSDYSTLQAALEQAGFCDTVQVAAGTYPAPAMLAVPPAVRLIGAGADQTTIQGAGQSSVLDVGDRSVVQGFTITGSGPDPWDAGIWISDLSSSGASPTISNNRIEQNSMGIAVYCFNPLCSSAPIINDNRIAKNKVGVGIHGGAPQVTNNQLINNTERGIRAELATVQIIGNTIQGSIVDTAAAGIEINNQVNGTIRNNRLMGNMIGITSYCFDDAPCGSAALLRNNLIAANSQIGIYVYGATPQIINNTVVASTHGLSIRTDGVVVRNNILANNTGTGIWGHNKSMIIGYNATWNNQKDYYEANPGTGALSADPSFVDAAQGDYHLKPGSPCINSGDPDPQWNDSDGSRNDLGAYGGPQ